MDYFLADMCMKGKAEIIPLKDGDKLLALLRYQKAMRGIIGKMPECGISPAFDSYLNLYDNTRLSNNELETLRATSTIKYCRN